MTANEIREAGLLELYILGELSTEEISLVENALNQSVSLREELEKIEMAFEAFAQNNGIKPSANFKKDLINSVTNGTQAPASIEAVTHGVNKIWKTATGFLCGLLLATLIFSWMKSNQASQSLYEADKALIECDSTLQQKEEALMLLSGISNPATQLFTWTATEKFGETDLNLFQNIASSQLHLKINELPVITDQQSYQLWSLKEGQDPIPLTVFNADSGIIPLQFEQGTGTYAITIEAKGGAQSPNLANLIATVTVS